MPSPHPISFADWDLEWEIPWKDGWGLVIRNARFHKRRVLWEASQPFILVPYHTGDPEYKDGRRHDCHALPLRMLVPWAPNAHRDQLKAKHYTDDDGRYDKDINPDGAVWVQEHERTYTEPRMLVLTAKFQCGNYQYVHRWEFRADGAIHPQVGLAGELFRHEKSRSHYHNFYYRLDFDIETADNNVVQVFTHVPTGPKKAKDEFVDIITRESSQRIDGINLARWRVKHMSAKNANGAPRSYEIILGSDSPPDGHYSTADLWVVNRRPLSFGGAEEQGDEIECTDEALSSKYAAPAAREQADVIVWVCLRVHHYPREKGEESLVVPYHFSGFHIEPRDFLDATPKELYLTDPPSPFEPTRAP